MAVDANSLAVPKFIASFPPRVSGKTPLGYQDEGHRSTSPPESDRINHAGDASIGIDISLQLMHILL